MLCTFKTMILYILFQVDATSTVRILLLFKNGTLLLLITTARMQANQ